MSVKEKTEIEIAGGIKVPAQAPVIVSASRSTDLPVETAIKIFKSRA